MIRSWMGAALGVGVLLTVLLGHCATAALGIPKAAPAGAATTSPPTASTGSTPPGADRGAATARLSIPSIGVRNLRVVPYAGTTDDWPGTLIQNRGLAASPHGARGGVGPGEIGNYLVTGHRLSAGGPLRELPSVRAGEKILVTTGGTTYTYTVTETRKTDFRSPRSLAEQRAEVPGSPSQKPTKAMITVSTCATLEDNAAGNHWRDAKDNPQHRIDKVGVLTARSKAEPSPGS
ncbi:hypothetical protein GCM10018793_69590 [Streptomyces sulfonofaciens]|uniref:Sortase n=2 Tax=Streptomyces sulfonofaciens TaxID=68272 RepID=A0A919GRJ8_9ACTN|nr:hypothetical protein GCM10018793_69590 [Streptomyces sulfonofaciens]